MSRATSSEAHVVHASCHSTREKHAENFLSLELLIKSHVLQRRQHRNRAASKPDKVMKPRQKPKKQLRSIFQRRPHQCAFYSNLMRCRLSDTRSISFMWISWNSMLFHRGVCVNWLCKLSSGMELNVNYVWQWSISAGRHVNAHWSSRRGES